MRPRVLLLMPVCAILFAGNPKPADLPLINRLDELVQLRFHDPLPGALGMSRIVMPMSMGRHFQPDRPSERDFRPENAAEREIVDKLEENRALVGLYVFGTAVRKTAPQALDYRALKGPGTVTRGTPRPAWYPSQLIASPAPADALPDWKAIYPVARLAMTRFSAGGAGFETSLGGWDIAARPVIAAEQCAACHNQLSLGKAIGGVLYALRRASR
jgi:hypothetical protein